MTSPGERIVCLNVDAGLPGVPSFRDRCATCGAAVWRSTRSRGYPGAVICLTCFGPILADPDAEIRPAPWVARDLVDAFLAGAYGVADDDEPAH